MKKKPNNGEEMKAFPHEVNTEGIPETSTTYSRVIDESKGMDLRDYFAAKAMESEMMLCSDLGYKKVAERAYEMADAMIKQRNK